MCKLCYILGYSALWGLNMKKFEVWVSSYRCLVLLQKTLFLTPTHQLYLYLQLMRWYPLLPSEGIRYTHGTHICAGIHTYYKNKSRCDGAHHYFQHLGERSRVI